MKTNQDEILTVLANRDQIEDNEKFARLLIEKCEDNFFQSVKFFTDYGYATSLDLRVYLWKDEVEGREPVMVVEYKPVEWGKCYDIVHDSDKQGNIEQLIIVHITVFSVVVHILRQ